MNFEVLRAEHDARLGRLSVDGSQLETPALFVDTTVGYVCVYHSNVVLFVFETLL